MKLAVYFFPFLYQSIMPSLSQHENCNSVVLSISNADSTLAISRHRISSGISLMMLLLLVVQYSSSLAVSDSMVEFLPGFHGPLPFQLQTGYVGVGEFEDVQLFYYFVKSESDPEEDPVLLWLTGGPGCSSLSGLAYEIGPFLFAEVESDGIVPTLALNPNSWTKMASIIFLDQPVGTGFSYARTAQASHSTNLQLCDHAYDFMRKWLTTNPEFISNPFYVGGDSYSGLTIPILTELISNGNEAGLKPQINLKGYMLGNPSTFPGADNYRVPFAHGVGIIPDDLYHDLRRRCRGEYRQAYVNPTNLQCLRLLDAYEECLSGIEDACILEPYCGFISPKRIKLYGEGRVVDEGSRELHSPKQPLSSFFCRIDGYRLSISWANDPGVQEALGIHKGSIGSWKRCNLSLPFTTVVADSRPYHMNLSTKGYRSLVYSGDHDMVVPHQSTQAWIKQLNYTVTDRWRSWKLDGQVAGYTRTYSNKMTFATVKGGGHTAPEYKPGECYAMFERWISHQPL